MRLIDTEKAWKTAQRIYSDPVLLHAIKNTLDATETIDATPVVHGRWVFEKNPNTADTWNYRCTACDGYNGDDPAFCPNCGAKMDGGVCDG